MVDALRGKNLNDDDRQGEGIDMKLVEMRASAGTEDVLPFTYQPDKLDDYFTQRPGAVVQRVYQVLSTSSSFQSNVRMPELCSISRLVRRPKGNSHALFPSARRANNAVIHAVPNLQTMLCDAVGQQTPQNEHVVKVLLAKNLERGHRLVRVTDSRNDGIDKGVTIEPLQFIWGVANNDFHDSLANFRPQLRSARSLRKLYLTQGFWVISRVIHTPSVSDSGNVRVSQEPTRKVWVAECPQNCLYSKPSTTASL